MSFKYRDVKLTRAKKKDGTTVPVLVFERDGKPINCVIPEDVASKMQKGKF
jgi:hypothetical protein